MNINGRIMNITISGQGYFFVKAIRAHLNAPLVRPLTQQIRGAGACQKSSIQNQILAGHEGGSLRTHPYNGFGDFHSSSEATDGVETEHAFANFGITEK